MTYDRFVKATWKVSTTVWQRAFDVLRAYDEDNTRHHPVAGTLTLGIFYWVWRLCVWALVFGFIVAVFGAAALTTLFASGVWLGGRGLRTLRRHRAVRVSGANTQSGEPSLGSEMK